MSSKIAIALFILTGALTCKKNAEIDQAIKGRYQKDADLLCNAIVSCLKEDMQKQIKNSVQREHVLKKMTRDLCQKNQYRLIGDLSSSPERQNPLSDEELYQEYSACASAVSSKKDCRARKETHLHFESCKKLRNLNL